MIPKRFEAELNNLIEKFDKEAIDKRIAVYQRYIYIHSRLGNVFPTIPLPIVVNSPLNDNELGNFIVECLDKWCRSKYQNARRTNLDLGMVIINLQGDLWRFSVPNFYGKCEFFIEKNLNIKGGQNQTNILRMCKEITPFMIERLTDDELELIIDLYSKDLESFQILNHWNSYLIFAESIRADLRSIKNHLEINNQNLGQVKYAFMQCVEKILKSFLLKVGLTEKELKAKYGHSIVKLAKAYNENYQDNLSLKDINFIECAADARYGAVNIPIEDIMKAQQWFFYMCQTINFNPVLIKKPTV